jgi:hypothetical protein
VPAASVPVPAPAPVLVLVASGALVAGLDVAGVTATGLFVVTVVNVVAAEDVLAGLVGADGTVAEPVVVACVTVAQPGMNARLNPKASESIIDNFNGKIELLCVFLEML